jgi:hypothetical protein
MSKSCLSGIVLAAATLVATLAFAQEVDVPRLADETSAACSVPPGVPPAVSSDARRPSKSLDIDVKIDDRGFRLGGRVSGSKGLSGAWVGAQLRGDGVTLDGRLEGDDGPTRDFKLNVDLLPGWARTAARLWLLLP